MNAQRERVGSSWTQMSSQALGLQKPLPRLPVPPLDGTLELYLALMEPVVSAKQMEKTRKIVKDFAKPGGVGETIQKKLEEIAEMKENWVSLPSYCDACQFLFYVNEACRRKENVSSWLDMKDTWIQAPITFRKHNYCIYKVHIGPHNFTCIYCIYCSFVAFVEKFVQPSDEMQAKKTAQRFS